MNNLRAAFAHWLMNISCNLIASKDYSLMLHVLIGLGKEQLLNRRPINYEQEAERLFALGLMPSKSDILGKHQFKSKEGNNN